jgi:hypothetical protein
MFLMKKYLCLALALFFATALVSQAAISLTPVNEGDFIKFGDGNFYNPTLHNANGSTTRSDYYGSGRGGAWVVSVSSNGGSTYTSDIIAFCAQTNDVFKWNTAYEVTGIADSLSDYGQWLYWNFAVKASAGTSTSSLFSTLGNTLGSAVQYGIWKELSPPANLNAIDTSANLIAYEAYITGNNPSVAGDVISSYKTSSDRLYTAYSLDTTWQAYSESPVRVAVISGQDQTVLAILPQNDPEDNGDVPEPAAILIWSLLGASWTGLALMRRRRGTRHSWTPEARMAIVSIIERGRK